MSDLQTNNNQRHPLTILREQASLLGSKTDNVVVAKVIEDDSYDPPKYDFYLIAIPLENFHHRLFSIQYEIPYPVFFDFRKEKKLEQEIEEKRGKWKWELPAYSEEEFESILYEIFHSERIKKVIGSLLTLSEEFVAEAGS
ncbi:MAG: hypothetical protein ACPGWR_18275 [Ardenticatenaceae bacterium]